MQRIAWIAAVAGMVLSAAGVTGQESGRDSVALPPYADTAMFVERELTIGAEPYLLPATLTLPVGARVDSPVPVVVLVHGSGPHDRDETIGRRKPLRDLAWGLATRGIGVLRYEKRTRLHAARMKRDSVTIEQETVADALAALDAARAQPEADSAQVYLLGHSLGAMIAPEIAVRDSAVAGVIMMAAGARPLAEMILDQLDFVVTLPENESPAAHEQIGKLRALVERVATGEAPPEDLTLGAPAAYFYDLNERAAPERALDYTGRMLLVQGERDYQVTMEDFRIWQETLAGRANVVFRSYPLLDHLFVASTEQSTPRETMSDPGFVDAVVVADIAEFILGR